MNNDQDFDLDDDIFNDDATPGQKVTLKKLWQENPVFKIVVIVVAIIAVYVVYSVFFKQDDNDLNMSRVTSASDITAIPGESESDPAYMAAVEEANRQRAEQAIQTNTSVLPTQIGSNDARIDVPGTLGETGEDPLDTWRRTSAAVEITQGDDEMLPTTGDQELAPILDSFNTPPLQPQQMQVQPPAPQPAMQTDPDMAERFAEQMRVIMGTKQPQPANLISTEYPSPYRQYLEERAQAEAEAAALAEQRMEMAMNSDNPNTSGLMSDGTNELPNTDDVIIAAGTVSYAQIVNAVNSDIDGPILAHILSGPFAGGRAIGSFQLEEEYLVLQFNRVVKDDIVYSADAYALDADTTLAGVRTDVNRHWFSRVILPAAAEFIAGMGSAIAQTATSSTVVDGAVVVDQNDLDTEQEIARGIESGAREFSSVVREDTANRDVTVTIDKGTPVGLLFVESIKTGDAQ